MQNRLWWLLPFSVIALCLTAAAQDFPKYEFSVGYGFSRIDSSNWNGYRLDGGYNLNPNLGIFVDISNPRSTDSETIETQGGSYTLDQKRRKFAVLAGPRVAARGPYTLTPYGHLLLGMARSKTHEVYTVAGEQSVFDDKGNQFGIAVGGGVDYKFKGPVSLRGQLDYMGFRVGAPEGFQGYWEKGIRLSIAIAFRFGDNQ